MEFLPDLTFSVWVAAAMGFCIGSFLNVVAWRLPKVLERRWLEEASHHLSNAPLITEFAGLSAAQSTSTATQAERVFSALESQPPFGLAQPASHCPQCKTRLRWRDNIPVLGWLALRGRCAHCGAKIPVRYLAVELGTGVLFGLIAWRFNEQPIALAWCAFASVLLAASLIDWDTTLLPDDLTYPLLWGGLLLAWLGWTIPLDSALLGAMGGYLALWSIYWIFKLATGKEGMGYGDFKLLAALGAWLGPQMLLPIVLGASAIGAVAGLTMKFSGALREGVFVPFGPFLAGGGLVVMLAGAPRVMEWMGWA
ncbi:prepilin peptidase [Inhella gelatinilytica]|uniref:Prepilin leader peptidase/N-methyltransferase n=1 Tax=Inhella gelatinilytica TaxID=2795030 RepID=A0A931NDC4_9BURK|nr:A24 family peptidase [Inhella gelatinilytica]MBH9552454.1 A24 family peptidase [Inhella gelatinilytica]